MKKILISLMMTFAFQGQAVEKPQDLTLYFIPSPHGVDWSTPAALAKSAAINKFSFKSRFIGHVWAQVRCGDQEVLTGMVGKKFDYFNQLLVNGRGLGILFHSFEGRIEDSKDIKEEMPELIEAGRINYARFTLNTQNCQRLMTYAKEYSKNNVGRYYGLANRPRYAEGSGCSAYGASFMEVAGVLDNEIIPYWTKTVNVPMELSGPPVREETVSLFKVITSAGHWAKENEDHKKIFFYDPDSMYKWTQERINSAQSLGDYKVESQGKMKGIVFDRSMRPAPASPIWLQSKDPQYQEAIRQQTTQVKK